MRTRNLMLAAAVFTITACGGNPVAPDRATVAQKRMDETCTTVLGTTTCATRGGGLYGSGH